MECCFDVIFLPDEILFYLAEFNPISLRVASKKLYIKTSKHFLSPINRIQNWFRRLREQAESQLNLYIGQYVPHISRGDLIRIYMLKYPDRHISTIPEMVTAKLSGPEQISCQRWIDENTHLEPYYRTVYFLRLPFIDTRDLWYSV